MLPAKLLVPDPGPQTTKLPFLDCFLSSNVIRMQERIHVRLVHLPKC